MSYRIIISSEVDGDDDPLVLAIFDQQNSSQVLSPANAYLLPYWAVELSQLYTIRVHFTLLQNATNLSGLR